MAEKVRVKGFVRALEERERDGGVISLVAAAFETVDFVNDGVHGKWRAILRYERVFC